LLVHLNKKTMIDKIAEQVREKRIEGITNIWDETSREGMRVVIQLKRDAVPDVVLNQLYRFSPLQTSFGCNMVALNGGRPETLNLKDFITAFTAFREEVVSRRTKFLLRKARERAHVLVGLAIAVANIDEVIALIRAAPNPQMARDQLMERHWPAKDIAPLVALIADPRHAVAEDGTYRLSEEQARAILELRLQRLTALGRDEIGDELNKLAEEIRDYLEILASRARIVSIIKDELAEIRDQFGTPRKTEIVEFDGEMDDEDLIQREDMVVTVSHAGYIKRVPLSTYRAQRRGGKGRGGMQTKDEDFVTKLFISNTHTPILFFSSRGICYKLKVWRLPVGTPQSRGKALVNILPLREDERITTIMPLPEDEETWGDLNVMFATVSGSVRRNDLSDFTQINRNGKIAMKLDDEDEILGVDICTESDDVLITTAQGQAIRFLASDVRLFASRNSTGVRGINLAKGDTPISMAILRHVEADPSERAAYLKQAGAMRRASGDEDAEVELDGEDDAVAGDLTPERYAELSANEQFVLTVSENGYGKRSSSYEYRVTKRGGKGIVGMVVNDRNGPLVASFPVEDADQIMLVTNAGKLIRTPIHDVRIAGRNTQGVRVFHTADAEQVVSVEHIPDDGEEGEEPDGEGGASPEAPEAGGDEGSGA
ncbi:MAG: DNA gyrase C-terminal beta-propeller domain-containing protein, partial [Pseudomonadota bacterium]